MLLLILDHMPTRPTGTGDENVVGDFGFLVAEIDVAAGPDLAAEIVVIDYLGWSRCRDEHAAHARDARCVLRRDHLHGIAARHQDGGAVTVRAPKPVTVSGRCGPVR